MQVLIESFVSVLHERVLGLLRLSRVRDHICRVLTLATA